MSIIRRAKGPEDPYARISKSLAKDGSLSFEARGVMLYLLSKPDDWEIQFTDVEKAGKIGRDKRQRIFAELELHGYFERVEDRTSGQFGYDYIVHEEPLPENPVAVSGPQPGLPVPEKPVAVIYKDPELKTEKNKHEEACSSPLGGFQDYLDTVLSAIRSELGLNVLRDEAGWVASCEFACLNQFPPELVVETFQLLRKQVWRKGRISPQNVADNLPELEKLRAEVAAQGLPKTNGYNQIQGAVQAKDPCPMCTGTLGPSSCQMGGAEGKCRW